jgi:hypothetical protein
MVGGLIEIRARMSSKPVKGHQMDAVAAANKLIDMYNVKDYDALERLIHEHVDFAHYNREIAHKDRSALIGMMRAAGEVMESRQYGPPERLTAVGDICVRESEWTATLKGGEAMRLRLCTVMRFDRDGVLVEWKDYG